jgi:hypothetical protein
VLLQVGATLKNAFGTPLPGRPIDFWLGAQFLCQGVTGANGFATCGVRQAGLAATLNLGYRATFSGDADHSASADTAGLIGVFVNRLP